MMWTLIGAFVLTGFAASSVDAKIVDELIMSEVLQVDELVLSDVAETHVKSPTHGIDRWRCFMQGDDHRMYSIEGLPDSYFQDNDVESAETLLEVSSAIMKKANNLRKRNTLTVNPGAVVSASRARGKRDGPGSVLKRSKEGKNSGKNQRGLYVKEGNPTVLVVRVSDLYGDAPSQNANKLSDDIFGTDGDVANLISQYDACSGGKLQFQKATGANILEGVVEVTLPYNVTNVLRGTVEDWTEDAVALLVDETTFTHAMYVLPKSVNFSGAAAYAYVGGSRSVYWESYASYLLVQMHEVGHNLNMRHSGLLGGSVYADTSCFMGAHVFQDDKPKMCFNGAKSWWLGWYSEAGKQGHEIVSPGSWQGKLVGVDDYLYGTFDDEVHRVILKVNTVSTPAENFPDLYVMYNRKEGVNSETPGHGDMVTIVAQWREGNQQSWLQDSLDENSPEFRSSNWDGTGHDLVIKVCDRVFGTPDYAYVIVYLDDNINNIECSVLSPAPSLTPSSSPVQFPSSPPPTWTSTSPSIHPEPSMPPSYSPSTTPSRNPSISPSPSPQPSHKPSSGPSPLPSAEPTAMSSVNPNDTPSKVASWSPTKSLFPSTSRPSADPSRSPSNLPLEEPSPIPSVDPTMYPEPSTPPSYSPSTMPSQNPSILPSSSPQPSQKPSSGHSTLPSAEPTTIPSVDPSDTPSKVASWYPTKSLSPSTSRPSADPSPRPSNLPLEEPSPIPSVEPTVSPSKLGSSSPTKSPAPTTSKPSTTPTSHPSAVISSEPSEIPSLRPTAFPTRVASSVPSSSLAPSTSKPSARPSPVPSTLPSSGPSAPPFAQPSATPSSLHSSTPTKSSLPSTMPSSTPFTGCTLAPRAASCVRDRDCCSGRCSRGRRLDRVCLNLIGATPSCVSVANVPGSCRGGTDCCSGNCSNGKNRNSRYCIP